MNIFEKDSFTLKEFCTIFKSNKYSDLFDLNIINNIIECYIHFSSGNQDYRKRLIEVRNNLGIIYISEDFDKYINFREILQLFDIEFTKLIIRIRTNPKKYDIIVSWKEFEEKIKNITKHDLYLFYKNHIL